MNLASVREEIKQRAVLSDWIGRWVRLHRKGHEYSGLCPFHQEKTPSFSVNNIKGFYHCFGCGAHGDIFNFLMDIQKWTFMEALEHLAHVMNISIPRPSSDHAAHTLEARAILSALKQAHIWFQEQHVGTEGLSARMYLEERGFPLDVQRTFELGYAPTGRFELKRALLAQGLSVETMIQAGLVIDTEEGEPYDRFRGRIIFPIKNVKDQVIAFGGRTLGEGQPKYLNSPETPVFHKGHTLYNLHTLTSASAQKTPLLVVEGYLDAMRVHQKGWSRVVAPLGTAITDEQIQILWQREAEPIFVLDGDQAGRKASERLALRALALLKPGHSIKVALLPEGEDPDTLLHRHHRTVFQQHIENAQTLVDFIWDRLFMIQDRATPERWALARKNVMDAVQTISDETVRSLYRSTYDHRLNTLERPHRKTPHSRYGGQRTDQSWISPQIHRLAPVPSPATAQGSALLLLGMCLMHPSLILDVSESLATLDVKDPNLNGVRDAMIQHLSQAPHIDHGTLLSLLAGVEWDDALSILQKHMALHGAFMMRLESSEALLEAWHDIYATLDEPRRPFFSRNRSAPTIDMRPIEVIV